MTFPERLSKEPSRFDFFWALRSLRAADPTLRLGESLRPQEDRVRLGQQPDIRFASSTLKSFEPGSEDSPAKLMVEFMGLFGPNGPLPAHVTDYAIDRLRNKPGGKDRTLVEFLNVFHHRLLSLFFRAWALHQKAVDADRPEQQRFPVYIGSLIGLGTPSLRKRDAIDDRAKLYFSGRLAPHAKNAEGLAAILTEYFGVPARIECFSGEWIKVPLSDACRLGESPATGQLGSTIIVGSSVWQCQTKFRVRLGPMTLADLYRLLPREPAFTRLKTWVLNYAGEELRWDAQYVLLAREVPQTQLGSGGLLGWTTWITTRKPAHDAEDVIIDPALN